MLPGTPGPRHSSPPRRQACGQAFPCLGTLGDLALQGPTCRAAHLTLGPGHQWPGSVRLQRTHHDRGFEGNFKGQAHGRKQRPPCAPPWTGVRTAWELAATSRLGLAWVRVGTRALRRQGQEASRPWGRMLAGEGQSQGAQSRGQRSSWLCAACKEGVCWQQGGSRLEERQLASLGTSSLGL